MITLHSMNCLTLNTFFQVHQDMNAPLSHYFIYTGHNSYLTGNQLSSDCSDVPIIKALQIGVRVIELDIWPNSSKDDIDVLHGRYISARIDTLCIPFMRIFFVCFCTPSCWNIISILKAEAAMRCVACDFIHVFTLDRTLTAPVSLIKCLRSIKEYAFVASPYPVIITLEDHLTPDLQAKVAKVTAFLWMINIWQVILV